MTDRLTMTVTGGVADVRLNRPEKLNALDMASFAALDGAVLELAKRSDVRCVVLSGEGRAFCAGIDLPTLAGSAELQDLRRRTRGLANLFQNAAWGWRTLPQPVIAAVHGYAYGGGFQLMLGADVRICAPDASLGMLEARWGLTPDLGGVALLRTLVRDDVAREITYTGRCFDGQEAQRLGLVTRLASEPRGEALALACTIAAASPDAVRAAKRLFNLSRDGSEEAVLLAESEEQARLLASSNHAEALAAAAGGREPLFSDESRSLAAG